MISVRTACEGLYYMEGDPTKRALLLPYLILSDDPGIVFFLDPWLDYPGGSYIQITPDMSLDAEFVSDDNIVETEVAASGWCCSIYPGMLLEIDESLFLMASGPDGSIDILPIKHQSERSDISTGCLWHQWWLLGSDPGEGYVLPLDIYRSSQNTARPFDAESWKSQSK